MSVSTSRMSTTTDNKPDTAQTAAGTRIDYMAVAHRQVVDQCTLVGAHDQAKGR